MSKSTSVCVGTFYQCLNLKINGIEKERERLKMRKCKNEKLLCIWVKRRRKNG